MFDRSRPTLRRIESAENSGTFGDIAGMLADDAVIMVPSHPVQEGKMACTAFVCSVLADVLEHFNRRIAYTSAEVRVIGDVAFDRGTFCFTVSPKSGGSATVETGKYFLSVFPRARRFVEDRARNRES